MFEDAHWPLLSTSRFAARMMVLLIVAVCIDGVALAVGAISYHSLEGLDWMDASLNAALVMTGNGPVHPPHTPGGKLFSVFYAMLGVILFTAVIGVFLIPMFHRMLHGFHSRRGANDAKNEQLTLGAGERHPIPAGGR
jgi:Ion channel